MHRIVTAELDLTLAAPAELILSVSAHPANDVRSESLTFTTADREIDATELREATGTRLHTLQVGGGVVSVRYRAEIGHAEPSDGIEPIDRVTYLRPSRYAESDALFGDARRRFRGLSGRELLDSVPGRRLDLSGARAA